MPSLVLPSLLTLAPFAGPPSLAAQAPAWQPVLDRFAARVADDVASDGVGGIAVGVALDGDLVWAPGLGAAGPLATRSVSSSPGVVYNHR